MAKTKPHAEQPPHQMTAEEFRDALHDLDFFDELGQHNDQGQSKAARFFGAEPRTARNWAANGPPGGVAIALRLMLALDLTLDKARALLSRKRR